MKAILNSLSPAQQRAYGLISQPGGHGYGECSGIRTASVRALALAGLVVAGHRQQGGQYLKFAWLPDDAFAESNPWLIPEKPDSRLKLPQNKRRIVPRCCDTCRSAIYRQRRSEHGETFNEESLYCVRDGEDLEEEYWVCDLYQHRY